MEDTSEVISNCVYDPLNKGVDGTRVSRNDELALEVKKPHKLTHRQTSNLSTPHSTKSIPIPTSKLTPSNTIKPGILPSPSSSPRLPPLTDKLNKPDIPVSRYNGDGSLRTRYKLPDANVSFSFTIKQFHYI